MNAIFNMCEARAFPDFLQEERGIQVSFKKQLEREQLWKTIAQYQNPKVVFWYIGANGFKADGAEYYRDDFEQILSLDNGAECILYDLTAWGALRNKAKVKLNESNPNVERINQFAIEGLRSSPSSAFFNWLQELDEERGSYMKDMILQRDFVYKKSEKHYNSCKIQTIFNQNKNILEGFKNKNKKDCANCYSALQYVEGLYLVEKLVDEAMQSPQQEVNVIFALPDDEWEYYDDESNAFCQDLEQMLERKWGSHLADKKIRVEFCTFQYGSQRPYNQGTKNIDLIQPSDLMNDF